MFTESALICLVERTEWILLQYHFSKQILLDFKAMILESRWSEKVNT